MNALELAYELQRLLHADLIDVTAELVIPKVIITIRQQHAEIEALKAELKEYTDEDKYQNAVLEWHDNDNRGGKDNNGLTLGEFIKERMK